MRVTSNCFTVEMLEQDLITWGFYRKETGFQKETARFAFDSRVQLYSNWVAAETIFLRKLYDSYIGSNPEKKNLAVITNPELKE